MPIIEITKRNGRVVPFDAEKITSALRKAFQASHEEVEDSVLHDITREVVASAEERFPDQTPSVERIQDMVELVLMEKGYLSVAKNYIVYRYEHTKIRTEKQEEFIEALETKGFKVKTRSGKEEDFSEDKILEALKEFVYGFEDTIDLDTIVAQLKFDLYEGVTTTEIERSLILVLRSMIERDPAYSKVAARMLLHRIYRDVFGNSYTKESLKKDHEKLLKENVARAIKKEFLDPRMSEFDFAKLGAAFTPERDDLFEYMGLEILSSRYVMEDPETQKTIETPQMFWMRIAMGLALNEPKEKRTDIALEFYEVLSNFYYTPGGRTLFQAGALKAQLSNCFLNVVPDSLDAIFKSFSDNAQYLKWSGGTGTSWSKVRATGSYIKGTGVGSQGTVPFLKIANDINISINRSGKRRGAGCVYLETWHLDIEDFLELRKNTGDERRRTHDLNTANWIPDLFMKRVRANEMWTLFTPSETPDLPEIYGKAFDERYEEYERMADRGEIKLFRRIPAADLWKKMLAMLFETGHPWITWKDPSNIRSPQDHVGVIHNSNLCTEITLNTSDDETAVCTIGSLNFAKFVNNGKFDTELVASVTRTAIRMLDNVIDLNFYPTEDARRGNMRHRPVGLGIRGYHDALYLLGIDFASDEALNFADESMEVVAYYAISASAELAEEKGTYETYKGSKWDRGIFPQDTIELLAKDRGEKIALPAGGKLDWTSLRARVKKHGMRNSNTMAIAPTASTANLVGCIPCVEPIYKNIYVKSNKEGEFVVVNKYLVEKLKELNLWNTETQSLLKVHDGSVQNIPGIPDDVKRTFREVFEIDGRWLIEAAARRGRWMDQSQSLNIFYSGTSGKDLSELYFLAWERGLKTTYYLRTLGASQVEKASVSTASYGSTHVRNAVAPEQTQAGRSAIDAAFLAKVAAGEAVGVCESCEA